MQISRTAIKAPARHQFSLRLIREPGDKSVSETPARARACVCARTFDCETPVNTLGGAFVRSPTSRSFNHLFAGKRTTPTCTPSFRLRILNGRFRFFEFSVARGGGFAAAPRTAARPPLTRTPLSSRARRRLRNPIRLFRNAMIEMPGRFA